MNENFPMNEFFPNLTKQTRQTINLVLQRGFLAGYARARQEQELVIEAEKCPGLDSMYQEGREAAEADVYFSHFPPYNREMGKHVYAAAYRDGYVRWFVQLMGNEYLTHLLSADEEDRMYQKSQGDRKDD